MRYTVFVNGIPSPLLVNDKMMYHSYMARVKVSNRQLRLPFITYYVTRVDGVDRTRVAVVDGRTWHSLAREHARQILRIEHKGFEYGLVANLVLAGTEAVPECPKARPWLSRIMSKLLPSKNAICGGSGRF